MWPAYVRQYEYTDVYLKKFIYFYYVIWNYIK